MKVACIGGGPAGLYLSILLKRDDPGHEITVYERDPQGSTYGWGVTCWRPLLDGLHHHDPQSARAVAEHAVSWRDGVARVGELTVRHRGDTGYGIGRHRLLEILTARARALGVRLEHGREVTAAALPAADLVVAADGAGSAPRTRYFGYFGTEVRAGRNRYLWLGTTQVFDAFTFTFVETGHGWIWAYGYPFDAGHSTFVVECAPGTWRGLGLDGADEGEGLVLLEKLFADVLDGHPLITGTTTGGGVLPWAPFRTLTNRVWSRGNLVLLGDAAHTTHYSVGAGTTLALEDAMSLATALRAHPALPDALARYERERRAALLPVQSAARYSARFYENLPRYLALPPERFFALLGQRHSPLLPHLPPRLYHRLDQAAGRLTVLRRTKRRLGPRLARTAQTRAEGRTGG